jgi:hypothetical protein
MSRECLLQLVGESRGFVLVNYYNFIIIPDIMKVKPIWKGRVQLRKWIINVYFSRLNALITRGIITNNNAPTKMKNKQSTNPGDFNLD